MEALVDQHRTACEAFSTIVSRAESAWDKPSPCPGWDARGVLEHVIGFHDVLLLRPRGTKPHRPKDDPVARWSLTVDAIFVTLKRTSGDSAAGAGTAEASIHRLLPMLTTDVLVHSWDLARAVGVEPILDAELCKLCLGRVLRDPTKTQDSGMFGRARPVSDEADAQTRLLAALGRDPSWGPPVS